MKNSYLNPRVGGRTGQIIMTSLLNEASTLIGVIKAVSSTGVAETMQDLVMNTRMVFDYLKMTKKLIKDRSLVLEQIYRGDHIITHCPKKFLNH